MDGNEFFVRDNSLSSNGHSTKTSVVNSEIVHDVPSTFDASSVGNDLKRFGEAVSDEKLDENKYKRYVKNFLKKLVNFQICHSS